MTTCRPLERSPFEASSLVSLPPHQLPLVVLLLVVLPPRRGGDGDGGGGGDRDDDSAVHEALLLRGH